MRSAKQVIGATLFSLLLTGAAGTGYMYEEAVHHPAQASANQYPLRSMKIELNGKLTSKPMGIWAVDPNSNNETTYMPIWYVMQAISKLGITNTWDGVTWNMTVGPAGIIGSADYGWGNVSGTVTNSVGGLTNSIGSLGNVSNTLTGGLGQVISEAP